MAVRPGTKRLQSKAERSGGRGVATCNANETVLVLVSLLCLFLLEHNAHHCFEVEHSKSNSKCGVEFRRKIVLYCTVQFTNTPLAIRNKLTLYESTVQ